MVQQLGGLPPSSYLLSYYGFPGTPKNDHNPSTYQSALVASSLLLFDEGFFFDTGVLGEQISDTCEVPSLVENNELLPAPLQARAWRVCGGLPPKANVVASES